MSDTNKKEPRTIHVDKLIIKANEVIFQPEENQKRPPVVRQQPIRRDFWGFPIPEIQPAEPAEEAIESEKKEEEK